MTLNISTEKLILVSIFLVAPFYFCFSKTTNQILEDELIINISSECAQTGSNVCFDFSVEDFTQVNSVQYTIHWDPSVLTYDKVLFPTSDTDELSIEDFGESQVDQGRLFFGWAIFPLPLTLNDGTIIYQLCFDVIGDGGAVTNITIDGDPLIIEVTKGEFPDIEKVGIISNGGAFETKADPNSIIINEQVSDLVLSCDAQVPAPMNFTATTGCASSSEVNITYSETQANECGNSFSLIRTWVFTNDCGDQKTIERRLDFVDNLAPVMSNVPENVTVSIPSDEDLFEPDLNDIDVEDNCSDPILTYVDSLIILGENNYQIARRFSAEDECENRTINEQLITVFAGDVWPGDTDNSFSVDQFDLFNVGFGFGEIGPLRDNPSIEWTGQYAASWDNAAPDGTNYRHSDTNGDGLINDEDALAIDANWEMTHNFQENETQSRMEFPLSLEINEINEDGTLELDIIFGDSNMPLDNFYGLAYTVNFDQLKIESESFEIDYVDNWIGDFQEDYLQIQRAVSGKCETAIVKKDHVGSNGFGKIGSITCKLNDAFVNQATELEFSISQAEGVSLDGNIFMTELTEEIVDFEPTPNSNNEILLNQIQIYPNPSKGIVHIQETGEIEIKSISLFNSLGMQLLNTQLSEKVDLNSYPNGIYIVLLDTSKGDVWKRIVKSQDN